MMAMSVSASSVRARPATTSSKVDSSPSSNVGCGIQVPSVVKATRTAPIGPSKGIPESIKAADAALIASTSCGFTWSAPMIVPTTCTSLRKPSGNDGRRGRSIRRQVRIAWSELLPSRRKNEPGILPAAYARSSMSTVSGKKSVPSRTDRAAVAVARRTVSPRRASTAPSASWASLPASKDMVRSVPLMGAETEMASDMMLLVCRGHLLVWFPVVDHLALRSDRQLAASCWRRPCLWVPPLPSDAETADDGAVALDVVLADVVEQPPALADELHQAAPGVVVPFVLLQVFRQVVDPSGQQGNLHLGRAGVRVVEPVLGDGGLRVGHRGTSGETLSESTGNLSPAGLHASSRPLIREDRPQRAYARPRPHPGASVRSGPRPTRNGRPRAPGRRSRPAPAGRRGRRRSGGDRPRPALGPYPARRKSAGGPRRPRPGGPGHRGR